MRHRAVALGFTSNIDVLDSRILDFARQFLVGSLVITKKTDYRSALISNATDFTLFTTFFLAETICTLYVRRT